MILDIFGIVIIIVFTIFVFRTANENGRHAIGWAVACFFTGILFQWVFMLIIFVVVGVVMVVIGSRPKGIEETLGFWVVGIRFGCLALSAIGMFFILKKVSKLPEDNEQFIPPPPPPKFDNLE